MILHKSVRLLVAAAMVGCAGTQPNAPSLDQEIELGAGTEVQVSSSSLAVMLTSVPEDSRCPTQVVCAWAGNAKVRFTASEGNGAPVSFELNTTLEPRSADVLGYRITLVSLSPTKGQPNDQIPTSQYQAKLRIVRLPAK